MFYLRFYKKIKETFSFFAKVPDFSAVSHFLRIFRQTGRNRQKIYGGMTHESI